MGFEQDLEAMTDLSLVKNEPFIEQLFKYYNKKFADTDANDILFLLLDKDIDSFYPNIIITKSGNNRMIVFKDITYKIYRPMAFLRSFDMHVCYEIKYSSIPGVEDFDDLIYRLQIECKDDLSKRTVDASRIKKMISSMGGMLYGHRPN